MKFYNTIHIRTLAIFATVLLLAFASCSNPAGNEEEHHEEAAGAVLIMNGQEIVRYENGEVTGNITVDEGDETALITIHFLAEDGDQFQPEEVEFSLGYQVGNTAVADIEQHEEDGKWSFHVHGESAGSTTVVFSLLHDSHSDFDTEEIPVQVN